MSLSYNYPPECAFPSAPPVYRAFPAPPRLHWGIVFALSVVTIGIFGMVWMVVQANWVKKVTKNSKPFAWCLAYLLAYPLLFLCAVALGATLGLIHRADIAHELSRTITLVVRVVMFVLYVAAAFTLKGVLEEKPIDIPLGGVMTFLLAPTYFQYHLFDYSVEGKVAEQLSGFGGTVTNTAPAVVDASCVSPES
jgi:hypothetical protein